MKGESQDTYLTFGENSISKASSVEEEFNVKNGGSYVTNNRQTDVIFHSKISDLANLEHPYLVSKNFKIFTNFFSVCYKFLYQNPRIRILVSNNFLGDKFEAI